MKQPKISVIISVWDALFFLKRCYSSLVAQTLKEFEIIFIDNGRSIENSKLLEELLKIDSRVVILKNAPEENISLNVQNALEHAQGEYVSFLDIHDCLDQDFFKALYSVAALGKYDFVKSRQRDIYADSYLNENKNIQILKELPSTPLALLFEGEVKSAIYNLSFIRKHDISYVSSSIMGDFLFLKDVSKNASKFKILIDGPFYNHYCQYDIQKNKSKKLAQFYEIVYCLCTMKYLDLIKDVDVYNNKLKTFLDYLLNNKSLILKSDFLSLFVGFALYEYVIPPFCFWADYPELTVFYQKYLKNSKKLSFDDFYQQLNEDSQLLVG